MPPWRPFRVKNGGRGNTFRRDDEKQQPPKPRTSADSFRSSSAIRPSFEEDSIKNATALVPNSTKPPRKFPMGFADLEKLSTERDVDVVPVVLDDDSGFKLLLSDEKLRRNPGKMLLVLRVLKTALESKSLDSFRDSVIDLLVLESGFLVSLMVLNLDLFYSFGGRRSRDGFEDVGGLAKLQLGVFDVIVSEHPEQAKSLQPCVNALTGALKKLLNSGALTEEESGLVDVTEFAAKLEYYQQANPERKSRSSNKQEESSGQQPRDFRRVPILPTKEELLSGGKTPNLREHLIDRPYKDFLDYLDVMFRLLREDFMRPFAEGISKLAAVLREDPSKFSNAVKTGDLSVWVYEEGEIVGYAPQRSSGSGTLTLKFKTMTRVNWTNTKRMIPGSLLCLSSDSFKTILYATVAGKVQVRAGQWATVDIKAESGTQDLTRVWLHKKFLVCENQAFFEGYRPFLQAMKDLALEGQIPFEKYIVRLDKRPSIPKYLTGNGTIELSHFLQSGREGVPEELEDEECVAHLMRDEWPSAATLGLDSAQMSVLQSALTSDLTVIQGPPGTGKTFIGLKIVETILRHLSKDSRGSYGGFFDDMPTMENCKRLFGCHDLDEEPDFYGRYKESPYYDEADNYEDLDDDYDPFSSANQTSPILVLCKTNHALDQFLEGILKFTKRVVRIGGQSKNTELQEFSPSSLFNQLESMWRSMHNSSKRKRKRNRERRSTNLYRQIKQAIEDIEKSAQKARCVRGFLVSGIGVVSASEIRKVEKDLSIPEDFSVVAWLGIGSGRDGEDDVIDDAFVRRVLEEEARLLAENHHTDRQDGVDPAEESAVADVMPPTVEDDRTNPQSGELLGKCADDCTCASVLFELTDELAHHTRNNARATRNSLYDAHEKLIAQLNQGEVTDQDLEEWDSLNHRKFCMAKDDLALSEARIAAMAVGKQLLCVSGASSRSVRPGIPGHRGSLEDLPLVTRWLLYRWWVHQLADDSFARTSKQLKNYERLCKQLEQLRGNALEDLLRCAHVVGMTTAGAARRFEVVRALKAKVVIVEEAAEVLEPDIVCSLPPTCEHLILIGDHQQLRPTPAVYELEVKYNLGISLFERLIRNNVPYTKLRTQWRMRPEISALLRPHIYRDLLDHESVSGRPDILGMEKNVFFVTHFNQESHNAELKSKSNVWEAEFLMALCQYLLRQGYKKEQITILTGYSGQATVLKERKSRRPALMGGDELRIDLVDNYQGEENDIILLSLVRSNEEGNIGFLKTQNRVNVALSRAKNGLYIVGDMDVLCSVSDLWKKIRGALERQGAVGPALPIKCSIHPDQKIDVLEGIQFPPHGTCTQVCDQLLSCGHNCIKPCHLVDREHKLRENACPQPCPKLCTAGLHPCKSPCGLPCPKCEEKSLVTLEGCSHEQNMLCGEDPTKVACIVKCGKQLSCGHACSKTCHIGKPDDTGCVCRADCDKQCERGHPCKGGCAAKHCPACKEILDKQLPCGHVQKVACHDFSKAVACLSPCEKNIKQCSHHCMKLCSEPCDNCAVLVQKTFQDCEHEIIVPCSEIPSKTKCRQDCQRRLNSCGHPCPGKCGEPCSGSKCVEPVECKKKALCGHLVNVPCNELGRANGCEPVELVRYCSQPCGNVLDCGHACKGTCSTCLNGRVHVPCKEACHRMLVCGHRCVAYCGQNCPPCLEKCLAWCEHGGCPGRCGEPCEPCKEICGHGCPHKERCQKPCGEYCGEDQFCDKPCGKELSCGHACSGLCGDKCPPLCAICNSCSTELAGLGLTDESAVDTANGRILTLPGCGHCIPAAKFEQLLDSGECGPPMCLVCSAPVYHLRRYQKNINAAVKTSLESRKLVFNRRRISGVLYRLKRQLLDEHVWSVGTAIDSAFPKERYWLALAREVGIESATSTAGSSWSKTHETYEGGGLGKKLNLLEFQTVSNRVRILGQLAGLVNSLATPEDREKVVADVACLVENEAKQLAAAAMAAEEAFLSETLLKSLHGETQRLWLLLEAASFQAGGKEALRILKDFGHSFTDAKERAAKIILGKLERGPSVKRSLTTLSVPRRLPQLRFSSMKKKDWIKCRSGHAHLISDWPRGLNKGEVQPACPKGDDDADSVSSRAEQQGIRLVPHRGGDAERDDEKH